MKVQDLLKDFQEKISLVQSYQRAARGVANSELQKLDAHRQRVAESGDDNSSMMSMMNFNFRSALDGSHIQYGHRRQNVEEVSLALELHLNKQNQWLLAEAYEEFEDFLEAAYASAGYSNNSFWPLSDYGNISLTQLPEKGWDWYLERAKSKKNRPESILSHFRAKLPKFAAAEKDNALGIDLSLSIALITQLRHRIVHSAGKVRDREPFVKGVLESVGLYANGKPAAEHRAYVEGYFFEYPYGDTIGLLDRRHPDSMGPIKIYVSVFDHLVSKLLASAHLLTFFLLERTESNMSSS